MAFDFPNTPTIGQTFQWYSWDGEKWIFSAGGVPMVPPVVGPPGILTGLIGWWDASVTASLTLSGSDILAIADQSGAGNHVTWSGAKPQYNATGFNSKPAFVCGGWGHSDSFINSTFPMGTGNTLTCWYVGRMDTSGITYDHPAILSYTAAGQGADTGSALCWVVAHPPGSSQVKIIRNSSDGPVACSNDVNHRVIITINSSGVQTIYVDGVSATGATSAGNWGATGTFRIGKSNNNAYWAGPQGECGVATGFSDATTVASLDTWLKNKWGL